MGVMIKCPGHNFRRATWAMDRENGYAWICKLCALKVWTLQAMQTLTGKES